MNMLKRPTQYHSAFIMRVVRLSAWPGYRWYYYGRPGRGSPGVPSGR